MAKKEQTEFERVRIACEIGTHAIIGFYTEGNHGDTVLVDESEIEHEAEISFSSDSECEYVAVYELKSILRKKTVIEQI